MIADELISENKPLADWLFLVGAILFVVLAILIWTRRAIDPTVLKAAELIALALAAVGLLVQ